jgi:hypothetical protein
MELLTESKTLFNQDIIRKTKSNLKKTLKRFDDIKQLKNGSEKLDSKIAKAFNLDNSKNKKTQLNSLFIKNMTSEHYNIYRELNKINGLDINSVNIAEIASLDLITLQNVIFKKKCELESCKRDFIKKKIFFENFSNEEIKRESNIRGDINWYNKTLQHREPEEMKETTENLYNGIIENVKLIYDRVQEDYENKKIQLHFKTENLLDFTKLKNNEFLKKTLRSQEGMVKILYSFTQEMGKIKSNYDDIRKRIKKYNENIFRFQVKIEQEELNMEKIKSDIMKYKIKINRYKTNKINEPSLKKILKNDRKNRLRNNYLISLNDKIKIEEELQIKENNINKYKNINKIEKIEEIEAKKTLMNIRNKTKSKVSLLFNLNINNNNNKDINNGNSELKIIDNDIDNFKTSTNKDLIKLNSTNNLINRNNHMSTSKNNFFNSSNSNNININYNSNNNNNDIKSKSKIDFFRRSTGNKLNPTISYENNPIKFIELVLSKENPYNKCDAEIYCNINSINKFPTTKKSQNLNEIQFPNIGVSNSNLHENLYIKIEEKNYYDNLNINSNNINSYNNNNLNSKGISFLMQNLFSHQKNSIEKILDNNPKISTTIQHLTNTLGSYRQKMNILLQEQTSILVNKGIIQESVYNLISKFKNKLKDDDNFIYNKKHTNISSEYKSTTKANFAALANSNFNINDEIELSEIVNIASERRRIIDLICKEKNILDYYYDDKFPKVSSNIKKINFS